MIKPHGKPLSLTRDQVFTRVKDVLIDALGVDDADVTPDASLVTDLCADSIDFLDIVFRLQRAFNFTIRPDELFPEGEHNILHIGQKDHSDRLITDEEFLHLTRAFPNLKKGDIAGLDVGEIRDKLFTVDYIVGRIHQKLTS